MVSNVDVSVTIDYPTEYTEEDLDKLAEFFSEILNDIMDGEFPAQSTQLFRMTQILKDRKDN